MVIALTVRRFVCVNPACAVRTFVEQVAGLSARYRRRTIPLLGMLEQVGLALLRTQLALPEAKRDPGLPLFAELLVRSLLLPHDQGALPDLAVSVLGSLPPQVCAGIESGAVVALHKELVLLAFDPAGADRWARAHPGNQ